MSESLTERLENLWAKHVAHCWQCADFSHICLIGHTLEQELLRRWSKELAHDPTGFLLDKESKFAAWRQLFAETQKERTHDRLELMKTAGMIPTVVKP